jgi:hypothetical protein
MSVYVANFGRENWAWPDCRARNTITMMEDIWAYPLWQQRDRDGYVREAQQRIRLPNGMPIQKQVASRWFNLNTEFRETANDIWIHRAGDEVWWTLSTDAPPSDEIIDDPSPQFGERKVHVFHKPCSTWSNRSRNGVLLRWRRLHPKARKFLSKPSTFQKLSTDNAAYARALINGDPLPNWHQRPDWLLEAE